MFRLFRVLAFLSVVALLNCGGDGRVELTTPTTRPTGSLDVDLEVLRMLEVADRAQDERIILQAFAFAGAVFEYAGAVSEAQSRGERREPRVRDTAPASAPAAVAPTGPGQCGGEYPPCSVRQRESGGNYAAVNPSGKYRGGWQFSQSTWDGTAQRAGRPDLVGVPPDQASVEDQDEMARVLWSGGAGCSHWSGPSGNAC